MIKMLAFDLDGTLLNTINDIGDAMNVALKKYDLPLRKEEEYPSFVGGGIIELTKRAIGIKVSDDVIQEGLNIKVPYIEKIVLMDCRTQKSEVDCSTASKDLQEISLNVAINFNVNKQTAHELYRQVGINYESIIINPAILESVKSVTAQFTAEELITKRAEVSNNMESTLKEKIESRGFNVVDFNITDLDFSVAYNQAIEKKQVAEQEAKQAQYELEKAKIENEKKIAEAEANAKVMQVQDSSTTENALKLKELEIKKNFIEKWNGVLPSTVTGDSVVPFLDI